MPKSIIWGHFTKIDSEKKVTCLYCPQQLSVANKSTCSLIRHLTKKHPGLNIRRHSSSEGHSREEILLNNDDTDANSESPDGPVLEYEIEEAELEAEEEDELDRKPCLSIGSKTSKSKSVEHVTGAITEAKRQLSDALVSIQSLNKRQIDEEDEYDHFGYIIATKLRKIQDMDRRETVMHSVYNVVYQALIKNI